MLSRLSFLIVTCTVICCCLHQQQLVVEALFYGKVHLVDYHPSVNSFLFRGDHPLVGSGRGNYSVDYPLWMHYMRKRAEESHNISTFPSANSKVYLVDITFENDSNGGFKTEEKWWQEPNNTAKGHYMQWLLFGDLVHPNDVNTTVRDKLIETGDIWIIDKIPTRLIKMREMLLAGPPPGYDALAVFVHCAAGCDRTGEFVASYRMAYQYAPTLATPYHLDCTECGRCPNWFATGGLAWYCLTWNMYNSTAAAPSNTTDYAPLPDCLTAYQCDLFEKGQPCQATGK